jgi:hypothetical protein
MLGYTGKYIYLMKKKNMNQKHGMTMSHFKNGYGQL